MAFLFRWIWVIRNLPEDGHRQSVVRALAEVVILEASDRDHRYWYPYCQTEEVPELTNSSGDCAKTVTLGETQLEPGRFGDRDRRWHRDECAAIRPILDRGVLAALERNLD